MVKTESMKDVMEEYFGNKFTYNVTDNEVAIKFDKKEVLRYNEKTNSFVDTTINNEVVDTIVKLFLKYYNRGKVDFTTEQKVIIDKLKENGVNISNIVSYDFPERVDNGLLITKDEKFYVFNDFSLPAEVYLEFLKDITRRILVKTLKDNMFNKRIKELEKEIKDREQRVSQLDRDYQSEFQKLHDAKDLFYSIKKTEFDEEQAMQFTRQSCIQNYTLNGTTVSITFKPAKIREMLSDSDSLECELLPTTLNINLETKDIRADLSNISSVSTEDGSGKFLHPHISSEGTCCFGTAKNDILTFIRRGELVDAVNLIWAWLNSYNDGDRYNGILSMAEACLKRNLKVKLNGKEINLEELMSLEQPEDYDDD